MIENSRLFYEEKVAPMIKEKFGEYEGRIAVGLSGEGSDCFAFDDDISRDHDFGTGVCLWLTDEDMALFGKALREAYDAIVDEKERSYLTENLRKRRGVMTIHDFYSNILRTDCDTDHCVMTEKTWNSLDHSCLKTATNGEIFRDDLGKFTAFRSLLLQQAKSVNEERPAPADPESVRLIGNAISASEKFIDKTTVTDPKLLDDFQVVDLSLLRSAVESADR